MGAPEDEASGYSERDIKKLNLTLTLAKKQKEAGNDEFKCNDFEKAALLYEKAYKLAKPLLTVPETIIGENPTQLCSACLTNKAVALKNLGDHQGVIATTNEALAIDPLNDKARWHRAKSCLEAGDPQQTIDDITEFKVRQKSQLTEANAILKRAQKELKRVPVGFGGGIRGMFNRTRSSEDSGKDEAVVCRRAAHVSYCGLKNEGATCYLNSVLQIFFHIPALHREVLSVPTSGEESSRVVFALQCLMTRMSEGVSHKPASATQLIASFGWDSDDTLTQQDCGEFVHVFLDRIEESMKGTPSEKAISSLFGVEVTHTDRVHEPATEEMREWIKRRDDPANYPLIVQYVKECDTIEEALEKMCAADTIEDFNFAADYEDAVKAVKKAKDKGEEEDKVEELVKKMEKIMLDGKMGISFGRQTITRKFGFKKLPPVLPIYLQRLAFCPQRMMTMKINSRLEFSERLDMSAYMDDNAEIDEKDPPVYLLFGVIVHLGSHSQAGHYVAFIRPDGVSGQWYRFDDATVTPVDPEDAIDANFGGEPLRMGGFMSSLSAKSAYMLMYVRESHATSVFDKSGLSSLVSTEVQAAVRDDLPASLPQAFTIALPHGRGIMTKAGEGDVGGGKGKEKEGEGEGEGRKLRGLLVGVTVPDAENATVKDLIRLLLEQCEANGQPLAPPTPDEYWGGVPPPWEGYEPDLQLILTSVKNNVINFFYDNEDHPLSQVNNMFLLRVEWVDKNPQGGGYIIPLCHCDLDDGNVYRHGDPRILVVYRDETIATVRERLRRLEGAHQADIENGYWVFFWFHQQQNYLTWNDDERLMIPPELPDGCILHVLSPEDPNGPTSSDFWAVTSSSTSRDKIRIQNHVRKESRDSTTD